MNLQRLAFLVIVPAVLAAPAVQAQISQIHANIRGGDDKCTFEVRVDKVAEVEIHGDTGILRTLDGSPASWVRLDCGQRFPNNPSDFKFQGVDGRGSQTLVRDPRGSGGVAVIRIEDPDGGSEGYTGDITWSGGESYWGGGGNWSSGGSGWNDSWPNDQGIDYQEAVRVCREQVARSRNVHPGKVSVNRVSGNSFGNYELAFRFDGRWSGSQSGRCSVARSGRLDKFEIDGGGWDDRISPNQALSVCERDIQKRFGIGAGDVRVQQGKRSRQRKLRHQLAGPAQWRRTVPANASSAPTAP